MHAIDRAEAARLDAADPLRELRDEFLIEDPEVIYLDSNSLGRLPRRTIAELEALIRDGWGRRLVRGWQDWLRLPGQVGDLLAEAFLGAGQGEVVVSDSTTVNLYKLAVAALDARPGRPVILSTADNFPTDRYVLEGLAARHDCEVRLLAGDPVEGLGVERLRAALAESAGNVALVTLSHVNYRNGALEEMAALTKAVHEAGALTLWDLSHSAGSVPIALEAAGADLAVGCTYKYLNGGPGAPAFLYVRRALQDALRQPIWGWFGQRDQFAMGPAYDPQPGIGHFLVGSPPVAGLVAVRVGATVLRRAGIDRLRAKAIALTSLIVELHEAWLQPLGFSLGSPRNPERRGSHVSLRHPDAWRICQALIEEGVIADFREPDSLRLGPAPAYTRFVDVWDALERLRRLLERGDHLRFDSARSFVT